MFGSLIETTTLLDVSAAAFVLFGLCVLCFAVAVYCSQLPRYVRIFMMVYPVLLFGSVFILLLVAG